MVVGGFAAKHLKKFLTSSVNGSNYSIVDVDSQIGVGCGQNGGSAHNATKKTGTITLTVGTHDIVSQPYIRYIEIMLDGRLTFKDHIKYGGRKAVAVNATVSRIMLNVGDPRQNSTLLLASVVLSLLLYGTAVWADALQV